MAGELVVITGGNRGIGFQTGRQLAARGLRVILASRDLAAGERAAAEINASAHDAAPETRAVEARALDVADTNSIVAFADRLAADGVPVWALVNNAGISLRGFSADLAARTLEVNFFGAARTTDAILPLMRRGGRIVMVSSGMGELSTFAPPLRQRFLDPALDRIGVESLARAFIDDIRRNEHDQRGWPSNAYRVSKAAMNALVRVSAPALRERGIVINAVCPGWVRTELGGAAAPRSLDEGAASVVWAVTLPDEGPTGGFFRDGRRIPW